jgi:hypothetical protein
MDKYFDKGENKCIEPVEGIAVRCLLSGIVLSGSLVITNFRLLYVSDSSLPIKEQSSISTEKPTEQAPQRSSLFPLRVVHISIPLHSIASVEVQELDLPLLLSELPSEQQELILTNIAFRTTGAPSFPQSTHSSGSRPITPPSFAGTGLAANSARNFQIPPGDRRVISSSFSTSTYPNSGAAGAADLVIVSPELIGGQTRRLPVVIVQTKQMGREVFIWPVAQEANSRSSRATQEFAAELRHYSGLSIDPKKVVL